MGLDGQNTGQLHKQASNKDNDEQNSKQSKLDLKDTQMTS